MRTLVTIAGASILGSLPAQTVWSMSASQSDLGAVVAAAAPGDIVLWNVLTLPSLTIAIGLTFVGPGTIEGTAATFGAHAVTAVQVPAGQQAHFVDVTFAPRVHLGVHSERR